MEYQRTGQVFCPNCRGGNPPGAMKCMWCGFPLAPPVPVSPLSRRVAARYRKPSAIALLAVCLVLVLGLLLGYLLFRSANLHTMSFTVTTPPICGNWTVWSGSDVGGGGDLTGVSAISPNSVWAVGEKIDSTFFSLDKQPLVDQWNPPSWWLGQTWTRISLPDFGSGSQALLPQAITSLGPGDIWVAGTEFSLESGLEQSGMAHWDGQHWSTAPLPNQGSGTRITSLTALSTDDVWAIGTAGGIFGGLVLHWNGSQWNNDRGPFLLHQGAISALSRDDIWAISSPSTSPDSDELMHWDGSKWTSTPRPHLPYSSLDGISAVSKDNVWVVGKSESEANCSLTLAMHWDGSSWTTVPSPNLQGQGCGTWFSAVAATSDGAWAVGGHSTGGLSNDSEVITAHFVASACGVP
jgi:hypothetical protein